ncbi:hypothetical protein AVEN_215356-1 [Araneus ventricosus]|uniref:Uncharacterized protein n=1 Tax=Araneus ventricosus TaxID=182803 RepID=A0A4Y2JST8_ARAVE|nr:hypothetical protein AVEN_215356-1 [Araneus ventricosus]
MNVKFSANRFRGVLDHTLKCVFYAFGVVQGQRRNTCETLRGLSKLIMYNFHYNVMKKEYGDKAELLFTDTDSLTYEVEIEDIYDDMSRHIDINDSSDYPRDHFLFSESNKKKIGCFKDELRSKPIFEFVGLRPKMYTI